MGLSAKLLADPYLYHAGGGDVLHPIAVSPQTYATQLFVEAERGIFPSIPDALAQEMPDLLIAQHTIGGAGKRWRRRPDCRDRLEKFTVILTGADDLHGGIKRMAVIAMLISVKKFVQLNWPFSVGLGRPNGICGGSRRDRGQCPD